MERHNTPVLRWVVIVSAIWIGVAVVRGVTYALTTAAGSPAQLVER
ncbi:hypothetical protein [Limobrevibacterium gyesilva]|uniref:Uncharacterized protein n=1 Tax=Limobrevibacterium gyesilva TaxID=2991712 RepID=A0AA41YP71_9PROT|nr:hypothetical protein [Limobrevibacterium gyesilva]MCW3475708.1 hypothetical protein [Limobrevibacterium gyesilva]